MSRPILKLRLPQWETQAERCSRIAQDHRERAIRRRTEAAALDWQSEEYERLMKLVGFHTIQASAWEPM